MTCVVFFYLYIRPLFLSVPTRLFLSVYFVRFFFLLFIDRFRLVYFGWNKQVFAILLFLCHCLSFIRIKPDSSYDRRNIIKSEVCRLSLHSYHNKYLLLLTHKPTIKTHIFSDKWHFDNKPNKNVYGISGNTQKNKLGFWYHNGIWPLFASSNKFINLVLCIHKPRPNT